VGVPRPKNEPEIAVSLPAQLATGRPKGDQVRELLVGVINGLTPGAMLPSERVLAERLQIARGTVRQEIEQLVAEGLLYRRPGHGTFVADAKFLQSSALTSFSQDMRARGLTPGARLVSVDLTGATSLLAGQLGIPVDTPIIQITRVRTAGGVPIALERATLSAERFPGLDKVDWTDRSLYDVLAREWGVRRISSERRVSAVLPRRHEATLLQIPANQPCFAIDGTSWDAEGTVEAGRSLYRADRYDLFIRATG
jgi:GntR family transcriptional regulator